MSGPGDGFEEAAVVAPLTAPWWDQKLTLLIAGFLLTGVVGSELQFLQKKLEWKRQIAFQAYSRKIAAMQKAREELTKAYVAVTSIHEQLDYALGHQGRTASLRSASARTLKAGRQERLSETALLFVAADGFQDQGRIKERLQQVVAAWKVLSDLEQDLPNEPVRISNIDAIRQRDATTMRIFDDQYDAVRTEMERQLGRFEDENRTNSF